MAAVIAKKLQICIWPLTVGHDDVPSFYKITVDPYTRYPSRSDTAGGYFSMNRILLLILLIGSIHARCQEFARRQYTVKDGLPGSIIYHALQDNNGFIWFA